MSGSSINLRSDAICALQVAVVLASLCLINIMQIQSVASQSLIEENVIDTYRSIECGTIVTNITGLLVKNPNYPEPTYTKNICEAVIERVDPTISKLTIRLRKLDLYRPTLDGQCKQDRFAIYTDLNAPITPIICGNHTGEVMTVPFLPSQSSLILSVITSDLDHDRTWLIEVEQGK